LSKRAAEEALGSDPRDISVQDVFGNLRNVLQSSGNGSFSDKKGVK
jgi:hypothetical protein